MWYFVPTKYLVPTKFHQKSTSVPAATIGSKFSADVIKRNSQIILLLREDISSYTDATLIPNETADSLRNGLVLLSSRMRSPMSPPAIVRTDPASALRSLSNNKALQIVNLSLELGDPKNKDKNPIAEKGIRELGDEIVRLQPSGGKVNEIILAQAISNLNSRIRYQNLAATEIWTQREMSSGAQLDIDDKKLIENKYKSRLSHHEPSAKF